MATKRKHKVLIVVIVLLIFAAVVASIACMSCTSVQNQGSDDAQSAAIDPTSPDSSAPEDDSSDTPSNPTQDFSSIVQQYGEQISKKAKSLSDEYEKAKFVDGESDADLTRRANAAYDALKNIFNQGQVELEAEKNMTNDEDAYNKALSDLNTQYTNSLQRLKDDIANLNS